MPGNDRRNAGRRQSRGREIRERGVTPAFFAGDEGALAFLNRVLKNELTAIDQYFLHSRMLADWGLSELAKKEYEESVDEMKHADMLIKRILFLGGLPNLQDLGKLLIGENAAEILQCDLKLERASHPDVKAAIAHCEACGDYVSREIFVRIMENEEQHIDWLQTQLRLIEQMGIQNFVQLQTKPNAAP